MADPKLVTDERIRAQFTPEEIVKITAAADLKLVTRSDLDAGVKRLQATQTWDFYRQQPENRAKMLASMNVNVDGAEIYELVKGFSPGLLRLLIGELAATLPPEKYLEFIKLLHQGIKNNPDLLLELGPYPSTAAGANSELEAFLRQANLKKCRS